MGFISAVLGSGAEQRLKRICESSRHKGSDRSEFFIQKDIGLGYRSSKIDDALNLDQPLANEDRTIWIVFDGEIYNKRELVQQMEKNHTFQTASSAEVVVHAYEDMGFACLNEFNGMFAFCLLDLKNKRIFSARDKLGIRPLYYYKCQDQFILASEIKGVLEDPTVPRKPNERFIYDYLATGQNRYTGNTFFIGIKEMIPAHYMIIEKGRMKIRKYWHPISVKQDKQSDLQMMDDDRYASEFYRLLRHAIDIRLPENLPFGIFLSGGLDSTSIAFLIYAILGSDETRRTKLQGIFSVVYERIGEKANEKPYIYYTKYALKADINYVTPSVTGQWNNIKQFVYFMEEPLSVFNYYVFWCLCQATKRVPIIVSGLGADSIVAGERKFVRTYLRELWKKKKIGKFIKELVGSSDWILSYLIWSFLFAKKAELKVKMLLAPQFVEVFSQGEMQKEDDSLQNALLRNITQGVDESFRVYQRASAAFGIECRHPFLDQRMVEFAFSLPATQKIRNGWTKYILRNAMKGVIPEVVRKKRKKLGLPIPKQRWMVELQQNIRKLFESKKFQERKYFNQPAILEVFDRYCEGKLNRLEREYYKNALWRIINLELWLELYFDEE